MNGGAGHGGPGGDSPGGRTVEDLLVARLRSLGVTRTYGLALTGLDCIRTEDPDLAVLLADADGRLGSAGGRARLGAATLAGPILHLSSEPGGRAPLQTVGSAEELLDALVDPVGLTVPGTVALHLDIDLSMPVADDLMPSVQPERSAVLTLDPSLSGLRLLALVGPGVNRAGAVEGLRSFSRAAAAPVLATWGAAGVERWDSPFHAGVGGLQSRDLELGGLDDADVVVTSGLDPVELPPDRLGSLVVQDVPPTQLAALCQGWPASGASAPDPGRLSARDSLTVVLEPLWESASVPLTGARAALQLSGALPVGGVAIGDPGPAGFWMARAFPAAFPGGLCVPATAEPGFAAAAALVCFLDDRPCLAVTDDAGAISEATLTVLDLARTLGASLCLQVWGTGGGILDSAGHVALLDAHLGATGVRADPVPVDLSVPEVLIGAAGPLVAWS